jgi:hypothetical protein
MYSVTYLYLLVQFNSNVLIGTLNLQHKSDENEKRVNTIGLNN